MRDHLELDRQAGFTLVEILIAFLVLSISLTTLAQSVGLATSQLKSAELSANARKLAEFTMVAASADARMSGAGMDDLTGLRWAWMHRAIERADASGHLAKLILTTVEISRAAGDTPLYRLKSVSVERRAP